MPKLSYPNGRTAAALKAKGSDTTDVLDPELEAPIEKVGGKPEQDDASIAFQKQIDELRTAEKLQRDRNDQLVREREEAIKRANERDVEIHSLKKTTAESQLDAVSNALTAANADAVAAQRDIEVASELGDHKALAEAYKRLSRAEVNAARLEDGKAELEAHVEAAKAAKVDQPQPKDAFAALPPSVQTWLNGHREYLTDPEKNAQIGYLHHLILKEGHSFGSDGYIESMERHIGLRAKNTTIEKTPDPEEEEDEPQSRNRMTVSPPVSREAPADRDGNRPGRVTLSVAQKEAAKIAGISEKDYAEQLIKLKAEKLNGNYGGQQ